MKNFLLEHSRFEGKTSRSHPVISGVPKGTVLAPLLFLLNMYMSNINIAEPIKSTFRLYAGDILMYRVIDSR